jgi:hypothetical protein
MIQIARHHPPARRRVFTMAASFDFVRRTALALPEVIEGVCFGTPTFYLRKKLMLRLREDGETLVIKIPMEGRPGLINANPDVFSVTDHYLNYPVVLANLNAIQPELLESMVLGAWRQLASKKQLAAFDQTRQSH